MRDLASIIAFSELFYIEARSTRRAIAGALQGREDLDRDFPEIQLGRAELILRGWTHAPEMQDHWEEIQGAIRRVQDARTQGARGSGLRLRGL